MGYLIGGDKTGNDRWYIEFVPTDIYICTLRKILSGMGAELKIIAHFPDTDVVIDQFTDLQKSTTIKRKTIA